MNIEEFSRELMRVTTPIHIAFVRMQPHILLKEKISFPQIVIMEILRLRGECNMGDIAQSLRVTKSAVTGLTDRLVRAGFLIRERSEADRRVVMVQLNKKGRALAKKLYNFKLSMIKKAFLNMSYRDRANYLRIVRKLSANILAEQGKRHA